MSKMDNLRAMREARYEQAKKRTGIPAAKAPGAPKPLAKPAGAEPTAAPSEPAAGGEAPCGHRNMSGRTCTRERGHAAKSHRYS